MPKENIKKTTKHLTKAKKMHFPKKFGLSLAALALVFLLFIGLVAVTTAFIGPTDDPSTAGFRSPCGFALSKDDNCTFDRVTDSLESISEKIDALIPE